jgi:hypothetical protein
MPQPPGKVLLTFIPRASLVAKAPPSLTRRCFRRTHLHFCPNSRRPFLVQGRSCSTHAAVVALPTPPLLRHWNFVHATKSKPQESDVIAPCQKEDTLRSLFDTCKRYAGLLPPKSAPKSFRKNCLPKPASEESGTRRERCTPCPCKVTAVNLAKSYEREMIRKHVR